ncbi:Putative membrane protein YqjE [Georgfuchsia toluolica]|uniref:Membrane protein YqjE n=1 Tax=Georgfuchsia toluolica TaxID=424218 RepID=A0A916J632_9PROT|nr:phage holin family protein [Georgfuchsia toluolica]CAG4884627.1 Putative membrane protein YqjE [Georgfuchsia toluolica]
MSEPRRSLLDSTRTLLDTALGLLQTRVELLVTEIEEEKTRLLSTLVFGATAFVLLGFGLIFLAITVTVLLWDDHRLLALVLLSAAFLGGGGIALFLTIRTVRQRERLFAASLAELKKDRAALRGEEQT